MLSLYSVPRPKTEVLMKTTIGAFCLVQYESREQLRNDCPGVEEDAH